MNEPLQILSFGAGVQSTTLLMLSIVGKLPRIDHAIFADTGWEPQEVYENLEWATRQATNAGIKVHVVSHGNLRGDVLRSAEEKTRVSNPPFFAAGAKLGMLFRKCSRDYKARPIDRLVSKLRRERGDRYYPTFQWFGISLDEIERMKVSRKRGLEYKYPLAWDLRWTRQHCLSWLAEQGYPEPPRSACLGCPYHSDSYWRRMRDRMPEEWRQTVGFDHAIRGGVSGTTQELYLHRGREPLDEVDLHTAEERGQGLLGFANECEGLCGV